MQEVASATARGNRSWGCTCLTWGPEIDSDIAGQTRSEGGFKANKVSAISVLDFNSVEKDGKTYYVYELLSRTGVYTNTLQMTPQYICHGGWSLHRWLQHTCAWLEGRKEC